MASTVLAAMSEANTQGAYEKEGFDAANSKGEILGFPPEKVVASVMGLFLIPKRSKPRSRSLSMTAPTRPSQFSTPRCLLDTIFYLVACGLSWTMLVVLLPKLLLALGRTLPSP